MSDQTPEVNDLVTVRQDEAVAEFAEAAVAGGFSELELLSGMVTVEHLGSGADSVLPLTRKPEATAKLFEAWQKVIETNAISATFDDETEELIQSNEKIQELIHQRSPLITERNNPEVYEKRKESVTRAIMRQRFAVWGSMQAIRAAQEQTGEESGPATSETPVIKAG